MDRIHPIRSSNGTLLVVTISTNIRPTARHGTHSNEVTPVQINHSSDGACGWKKAPLLSIIIQWQLHRVHVMAMAFPIRATLQQSFARWIDNRPMYKWQQSKDLERIRDWPAGSRERERGWMWRDPHGGAKIEGASWDAFIQLSIHPSIIIFFFYYYSVLLWGGGLFGSPRSHATREQFPSSGEHVLDGVAQVHTGRKPSQVGVVQV